MDLLSELKRKTGVSWDSDDDYLQGIIGRAKEWLQQKAGIELDFDQNYFAIFLLIERCFYVFNNAANEFEENYKRDILFLILSSAEADDDQI